MEGGVQNRDPIAEAMIELSGHRGRQRDLGHQQQRIASAGECRFDRAQIHFCLARASHALQQKGCELRDSTALPDRLKCHLLVTIQRRRRFVRIRRDGRRFHFQRHQLSCAPAPAPLGSRR